MERKTKFSHQHGDHIRNISPYKIYREKFKRWKYPFIGLGVFLMFLISFEATGELGRTDVLDSLKQEESFTFTQENLDFVKKGMLFVLDEERKQCESLELNECAAQAKNFIALVSAASIPEEAEDIYSALEESVGEWDDLQEKASCENDRRQAIADLEHAVRLLEDRDSEKALELKNNLEEIRSRSSCF